MSACVSFVLVVVSLMSSSGVANNEGDFIFAVALSFDGIIIFVVAAGATAIKAFDVHDVANSNSDSNKVA